MSTTTPTSEANPFDSKAVPPGLKPRRIDDAAYIIALDTPSAGEASKQGFYLTPTSLTWFIESVKNEVLQAQANMALMSLAAVTGLDGLTDDQLARVLGSIEDQLARCAAMADEALRRMIASDWGMK